MTADERIEKLLNRFGQTISDLPKPNQGIYVYAYNNKDLGQAQTAANQWCTGIAYMAGTNALDYICHLADVIDRMETALETATLAIDCGQCQYVNDYGCEKRCIEIAKISDRQLAGLKEREFEEFIDKEEHTHA